VITEHAFEDVVGELCRTDRWLAGIVEHHGVPSFAAREPGFAALVWLILEQQVSLASAAAAFARLERRVGEVSPDAILSSSVEDLQSDGFSRQKAGYVRGLASAVTDGHIDLVAVAELGDDEARLVLTSLKGIGTWTADVYLLSCLGRADVWPVGDRALQVSVYETLELEVVPDAQALMGIGERWRPHRSTAARLLWHGYLSRRGR
jgi:DNA-3-methyladenine glycosylase II